MERSGKKCNGLFFTTFSVLPKLYNKTKVLFHIRNFVFTRYVLHYKHNTMKIRLQCFILYRPFHRFFFSTSNMDNLGKIRRLHRTERLYKLAQLSSLKVIRRKLKLTPQSRRRFYGGGRGAQICSPPNKRL